MDLTEKQKMIGDIRSNLVCPSTALQIFYEEHRGGRVPKDFIKQALDDIEEIVQLLELINDDKE